MHGHHNISEFCKDNVTTARQKPTDLRTDLTSDRQVFTMRFCILADLLFCYPSKICLIYLIYVFNFKIPFVLAAWP